MSLFVRNKQDLMPLKVKWQAAFLPLRFYSPSVRHTAGAAVAPLGIWPKNVTLAEMLLRWA